MEKVIFLEDNQIIPNRAVRGISKRTKIVLIILSALVATLLILVAINNTLYILLVCGKDKMMRDCKVTNISKQVDGAYIYNSTAVVDYAVSDLPTDHKTDIAEGKFSNTLPLNISKEAANTTFKDEDASEFISDGDHIDEILTDKSSLPSNTKLDVASKATLLHTYGNSKGEAKNNTAMDATTVTTSSPTLKTGIEYANRNFLDQIEKEYNVKIYHLQNDVYPISTCKSVMSIAEISDNYGIKYMDDIHMHIKEIFTEYANNSTNINLKHVSFYNDTIKFEIKIDDVDYSLNRRILNSSSVIEMFDSPYINQIGFTFVRSYVKENVIERTMWALNNTANNHLNSLHITLRIADVRIIAHDFIKAVEYLHSKGYYPTELDYNDILLKEIRNPYSISGALLNDIGKFAIPKTNEEKERHKHVEFDFLGNLVEKLITGNFIPNRNNTQIRIFDGEDKVVTTTANSAAADICFLSWHKAENPPRNIEELLDHPFFTKRPFNPKNDKFGKRYYKRLKDMG